VTHAQETGARNLNQKLNCTDACDQNCAVWLVGCVSKFLASGTCTE